MLCRKAFGRELDQSWRHSGRSASEIGGDAELRERDGKSPRSACCRGQLACGKWRKRVGHGAPARKAAFGSQMVGTTRARSRKSLCCSQDVSAISRQPWQAAPCRNRRSCWFSGRAGRRPGRSSKAARIEGGLAGTGDLAAGLDQAAERAFCVRGPGVEQDAIARVARVDSLPDRAARDSRTRGRPRSSAGARGNEA